jgi:hypothetical protein
MGTRRATPVGGRDESFKLFFTFSADKFVKGHGIILTTRRAPSRTCFVWCDGALVGRVL